MVDLHVFRYCSTAIAQVIGRRNDLKTIQTKGVTIMLRLSVKVCTLVFVATFVALAFGLARQPVQAATFHEVKQPCTTVEGITRIFSLPMQAMSPAHENALK